MGQIIITITGNNLQFFNKQEMRGCILLRNAKIHTAGYAGRK